MDYLPVSEKNIDEMYEELCGIIRSVNNPYYKKLLSSFFLEDKEFENVSNSTPQRKPFIMVLWVDC